jgi:hypothetical protein
MYTAAVRQSAETIEASSFVATTANPCIPGPTQLTLGCNAVQALFGPAPTTKTHCVLTLVDQSTWACTPTTWNLAPQLPQDWSAFKPASILLYPLHLSYALSFDVTTPEHILQLPDGTPVQTTDTSQGPPLPLTYTVGVTATTASQTLAQAANITLGACDLQAPTVTVLSVRLPSFLQLCPLFTLRH